jgi:uncharacterized protein (DUF58 family)
MVTFWRLLGALLFFVGILLAVSYPSGWFIYLCGGALFAGAALSFAGGAQRRKLQERQTAALEELARQGRKQL